MTKMTRAEDNDEESEREDDTSDIENNGVSEEDRMRLEAEKVYGRP